MTLSFLSESRLALLGRDQLETLLNLSHAFNSTMELDALMPRILNLSLEVTEAEAGAVWLVHEGFARCTVAAGPAAAELDGASIPLDADAGVVGEVIRSGTSLLVPNALEDPRFAAFSRSLPEFSVRSAVVIPLRVHGTCVGAIELVNEVGGKDEFNPSDLAFLEALADDAAAAVRNATLYDAERRARHFQTELNLFGQLFVVVIVMLAVGIALGTAVGQGVSPALQVGFSWAALLIFLLPIHFFSRFNRIPLSEFGVTTAHWKRHALEGALVAIPLIALMPVAKIMLFNDTEALVTFAGYTGYPRSLAALHMLLYLPHTFLQELAARGLIQGSLQRFMVDSHPYMPVIVTSALFGVGHLYVGFSFAFITFVASLVLGAMYMRQGSLVGVTLTHAVCGMAALALGLF